MPLTAHFIGGCAIGDSPETGVIDPYQRVYGHPGLHVADGSAVSANLGVNPSLTITAQAERAMALWPNKGEADPRPALGEPYVRVAAGRAPVARRPRLRARRPAAADRRGQLSRVRGIAAGHRVTAGRRTRTGVVGPTEPVVMLPPSDRVQRPGAVQQMRGRSGPGHPPSPAGPWCILRPRPAGGSRRSRGAVSRPGDPGATQGGSAMARSASAGRRPGARTRSSTYGQTVRPVGAAVVAAVLAGAGAARVPTTAQAATPQAVASGSPAAADVRGARRGRRRCAWSRPRAGGRFGSVPGGAGARAAGTAPVAPGRRLDVEVAASAAGAILDGPAAPAKHSSAGGARSYGHGVVRWWREHVRTVAAPAVAVPPCGRALVDDRGRRWRGSRSAPTTLVAVVRRPGRHRARR